MFVVYNIQKKFNHLLTISFKILEFDKKNSVYNFQTAYALEKNGFFEKSIKYYNEALNLGLKDKKNVFNNLANIYLDLKKIEAERGSIIS